MRNKKKETRCIKNAELRTSHDNDVVMIVGYPVIYNSNSEDMGFIERVAPGACKNALVSADVRALINHDPSQIVGRTGVNLTLSEDEKGLYMELVAPPKNSKRFDQLVNDIESGLITQQSYGFTVKMDEWVHFDNNKPSIRTIIEIDQLFDVSPVTYPAYPDTTVALRSLDEAKQDNLSIAKKRELALRDEQRNLDIDILIIQNKWEN